MEKLNPLAVEVDKVKPLLFGDSYESRMILDHVITGRDNVIQINHGTVKAGYALGGGVHDDDEIYYILSGKGKLQLDDEIIDGIADYYVSSGLDEYEELTDDDINDIILSYYDAYLKYLENGTIPDGVGGLIP